jgi:hypothetical protein
MSYLKKKLIYIDSKYKGVGASASDFEVDLRDQLQEVVQVIPHQFSIVNSFYNIRGSTRTLDIKVGTTEYHGIIIPNGFYESYGVNSISDAIEEQITSRIGGVSVSISTLTGKLTFEHATLHINVLPSSTIKNVIGFTGDEVASLSITGTNMIDLRAVTKIFVHMKNIVNDHFITESGQGSNNPLGSDVILSVNMTAGFGEELIFINNDDTLLRYDMDGMNMSRFRISLTDSDNNLLDTFGFDWNITLAVVEYTI